MSVTDRSIRLEPHQTRDWADATAARVHDPLWFLARQWQLGEYQGENATTPVLAQVHVRERPIEHSAGAGDPTLTPAEAMVESELDDWWTLGRRIRAGIAVERSLNVAGRALPDDPELRLTDLAPPYQSFEKAWDGLALWHLRRGNQLNIPDAAFGATPPAEVASAWSDSALNYEQEAAFRAAGLEFDVHRHRGGRLDWYSVDARAAAGVSPVAVDDDRAVIPARIDYPGMPLLGVWEIEDATADIGAVAPDSSHSPTAIMTDLYYAHHDEWFDVPIRGRAGSVLTLTRVVVTDSFGIVYDSADRAGADPLWIGLQPPSASRPAAQPPWTLFQTVGLEPNDLLLWHVAELPLVGDAIERVQFGVDDASNLVWAVERRLRGRDASAIVETAEAPGRAVNPTTPNGDRTGPLAYAYVPGLGAAVHWIPYAIDETDTEVHRYIQRRLVDLSVTPPRPMPLPTAAVLSVEAGIHRISASAIPPDGLELERRWQLARDANGRPVLWVQRQARPLLAPPSRRLVFDVAEPVGSPSGL